MKAKNNIAVFGKSAKNTTFNLSVVHLILVFVQEVYFSKSFQIFAQVCSSVKEVKTASEKQTV